MKRISICVAALLLLLPPASSQSQVTLRLTGGPTIATWVWPERAERQEPWSWHGGALGFSAGIPISGNWGIQLEGGVTTKGFNRSCGEGCWIGKWIPYAEYTVLADRRIRLGNRFRWHLLAGPALGYRWDPNPRVAARFDFGIAGGAQFETRLYGRLGLSVGALYTHGLKNVNAGFVIDEWKDWFYAKSRTLTLRTGLSFTVG